MRAVLLESSGQLSVTDVSEPKSLGGVEVRLRVKAVALSLRDSKLASGAYNFPNRKWPLIPGGACVGEIIELGREVTGWKLGQRVIPNFIQGWVSGRKPSPHLIRDFTLGGPLLDGALAEQLCVRAESLVAAPAHLGDAEAATLAYSGLTAYAAVSDGGWIYPDQTIVVQGTSAIALMALQLTKGAKAKVIVTSKQDDKLARVTAMGADAVIHYGEVPQWSETVLGLSRREGADLVLDPGGAASMAESVKAVRPGGTISVIGALGSAELPVSLPYLLAHNLRLQGAYVGSRDMLARLVDAVARHDIRPVIEQTAALSHAPALIAAMPKLERFGSVCITLG